MKNTLVMAFTLACRSKPSRRDDWERPEAVAATGDTDLLIQKSHQSPA
jgi:hypothetical protein